MFLIISKDGCEYCDKAIYFLVDKNEEYIVIDKEDLPPFYIEMFKHQYNHHTYPFIFEFMGGYDVLKNRLGDIQRVV